MNQKTCTSCGDDFPATKDYFHGNGYGRLHPQCKGCRRIDRCNGYTSGGRSPSIPSIKITAARALYGAGFDVEYIADDLGVSRAAVKSLFRVTA